MRRVPELDALRGLAALAIVLFHLKMGVFPGFGSAIDLFFVLSGYLITSIVLREWGTRGFLRIFYIRRALRIWPIYYLAIAACYLMNPCLPRPDPLEGSGYFWTYTQFIPGYWGGEIPTFSRLARHTWTLAIEEQFYLFWPVLVGLAGRRWLLAISLPMLLAPVVMRSMGFFPHLLLTRCDGLALGAILAGLLFDQARVERNRRRFQVGFAAVFALALAAWALDGPGSGASGPVVVRAGLAPDLAVPEHGPGRVDLLRAGGPGGLLSGGSRLSNAEEPPAGLAGPGQLRGLPLPPLRVLGRKPRPARDGPGRGRLAGRDEAGGLRGTGRVILEVSGETDPLTQGPVSVRASRANGTHLPTALRSS